MISEVLISGIQYFAPRLASPARGLRQRRLENPGESDDGSRLRGLRPLENGREQLNILVSPLVRASNVRGLFGIII